MRIKFRSILGPAGIGFVSLLITAFAAMLASAQDASEDSRLAIEEVIVTGMKRDVGQQDLGAAVSTVTANQMEMSFSTDITALTQLSPNVTFSKQHGFNAVGGGIRGTGFMSILVTKDPSVGFAIDDFAINHVQSQWAEMFDIEQVEIFRGPQGTLFGKNTTGGAVNITTKKPVLGEFFGKVQASYGQFASNDSEVTKATLELNIPLGETLAMRIAAIHDYSDGFYTNDKPPGGTVTCLACSPDGVPFESVVSDYPFTGDGSDIGGKDVTAAKIKLRYQPNDFYMADFTWEILRDDSETPAAANVTPEGEGFLWPLLGFPGIGDGDPFSTGQSYLNVPGVNLGDGHNVDTDGYYLTQTFSLDNYTVKSITGYRDQEEILNSTYTGEAYTSLYDAARNSVRETFQQELRLSSDLDGPLNFVVGAAYYTDDVDFNVFGRFGFLPLASAAAIFDDILQIQATEQERESYAFYVDGTYELTESTRLSLGYRHTRDEKEFHRLDIGGAGGNPLSNFLFDLSQVTGPFDNPLPESAFALNARRTAEFSANTYRIVVDHDFREDIMVYASFATGFVAGGFAETCGIYGGCKPFNSEENDSFEIGLKADLLDGKMRLNLAIYDVTYESLQRDAVLVVKDASGNDFQETVSVNEGESSNSGIEIEMIYLPTDNLRVDFNLGTMDHEYDEYAPSQDMATLGLSGPPQRVDLTSMDVPFSPELTMGIGLTYDLPLASGATMVFNLSAHYQDEFATASFPANYQGADSSGNPIIRQKQNTSSEERTLVDGYIKYIDPDERFEITAYGKNITDETWRNSAQPVSNLWTWAGYGPPREIGVRVGFNF